MIRILLIPLILCFTALSSFSAINGGISYGIPIDYTKLNQSHLEERAKLYYGTALNSRKLDENMTAALNLYSILSNAQPDNIIYALKLGRLYDVLGKDRYAKELYYRAMSINPAAPEPYFYLGEYYYDRELYGKALRFYEKAYDKGYSNHSKTLNKISAIYQKFGENEKSAQLISPHQT